MSALPSHMGAFIGRQGDLDHLCRLVAQARLVTVVGPPGVGKSRVATEVAHVLADAGREVAWVDLDGATSVEDLCRRASASLEIPLAGMGMDAAADRLAVALAGRSETVTFLDHVERLQPEALALLGRWLSSAPEARLVAASRKRLDLEGECVHVLSPLEVSSAVALLVDLARAAPPCTETLGLLTRICERLDCLPLAIEFAAARLRIMPPEELERRLSDRWKLLRTTTESVRAPHRTLEDAIRWSWEDLSADAQSVLAQLPVFRAPFTLSDAEAVVKLPAESTEPVMEAFQQLCDRCLIQSVDSGRFRLLASIAEFAEGQVHHDVDALARRYLKHVVARVVAMGDQPDPSALASAEPDLAAAHAIAMAQEDQAAGALNIATALGDLAVERGPLEFGDRALLEALSHAGAIDEPLLRARAAARLGHLRLKQGRLVEATECFDVAERGADARTLARIVLGRGAVDYARGELSSALVQSERSAELARAAGCAWTESTALFGVAALQPPAVAAALVTRAVAVGQRAAKFYHGPMYLNAAGAALWRGALAEAERWLGAFDQAVESTPAHYRGAYAVIYMALVRQEQGSLAQALALADRAFDMFSQIGATFSCAEARGLRGHIHLLRADYRRAEEEIAAALDQLGPSKPPRQVVLLRTLRAVSLARRRDFEAAAWELDEAGRSVSETEPEDRWIREATVVAGRGLVAMEQAWAPMDEGGVRDTSPLLDDARQRLAWATSPPSASLRFQDPQLRQLVAELQRAVDSGTGQAAGPKAVLKMGPDAAWFEFDGAARVDLSRRAPVRRLLVALVGETMGSGRELSVDDLFRAGWPGERVQSTSAANRVYWGIKVLRNLGLRPWLTRDTDGYRLESSLTIRQSD